MKIRKIYGPLDAEFLKGGAGSGNFGHAGRPGERGGSGSGGGSKKVPQGKLANIKNIVENGPIGKSSVGDVYQLKYKDGSKAVFKPDETNKGHNLRRNIETRFTKSSDREMAAHDIDKEIGTNLVPHAEIIDYKDLHGKGIAIEYVENTSRPDHKEPDHGDLEKTAILDIVIGNTDRHDGNYLVKPDGKIAAIDHNLAFAHKYYDNDPDDIVKNQVLSMPLTRLSRGSGFVGASARNIIDKINPDKVESIMRKYNLTDSMVTAARARIAALKIMYNWKDINRMVQ